METNIQKMQVLLETVRAGSFTRAAERLSYSQSGVSRMVADLEADWGFKVLDRSREGVALSADGRQVMPAVEALCEEFTRLQRRVDEMRGLMRGKICIGTFSSVATHVLPPVIARFRADHPDVDYELLMGDYSEIEQWVAEGRCDLGFIPREPRGQRTPRLPPRRSFPLPIWPTSSLSCWNAVATTRLRRCFAARAWRCALSCRPGMTMRLWLWSRTAWALAFFPRSSCVAVSSKLPCVRSRDILIGRSMRYIERPMFRLPPPVSSNTSKRVRVIVHFGQISESGAFSYEIELSNEVPRYTAA